MEREIMGQQDVPFLVHLRSPRSWAPVASICAVPFNPAQLFAIYIPPVPAPLGTTFSGVYHNWTDEEADDIELIELYSEDQGTEGGGKSDKFNEEQTRTLKLRTVRFSDYGGTRVRPCTFISLEINFRPNVRVTWTRLGEVIGTTRTMPTWFPSEYFAEKRPAGANDLHIESKDPLAGAWVRKPAKPRMQIKPDAEYRYQIDIDGITDDSDFFIHRIGKSQERIRYWWTKDGTQIGDLKDG